MGFKPAGRRSGLGHAPRIGSAALTLQATHARKLRGADDQSRSFGGSGGRIA
jgi:hypothetical protein